jgi:putative hydrolase of HD superfamily
MAPDRLAQQLAFLLEIDRLKQINRQTLIADGTRRENDAEHSWHLAVWRRSWPNTPHPA